MAAGQRRGKRASLSQTVNVTGCNHPPQDHFIFRTRTNKRRQEILLVRRSLQLNLVWKRCLPATTPHLLPQVARMNNLSALYTSKFQAVSIAPSSLQNGNSTSNSSSVSPTLSSPPSHTNIVSTAPATAAAESEGEKKRLTACLVCRKRKLKCDSARPKCASCARLGHAWYLILLDNLVYSSSSSGYEETRKKSGPKQGYVKKLEQKSQTLEQRLAQLERLLATHQTQLQSASPASNINAPLPTPPGISPLAFESISASASDNQFSGGGINPSVFSATQPIFPDLTPPDNPNNINLSAFPLFTNDSVSVNNHTASSTSSNPLDNSWAWDLVSLGMQEELPPDEITNKLYTPYDFDAGSSLAPSPISRKCTP